MCEETFRTEKIRIVFETSKPKIVWWQLLFWKNLSAQETIDSYRAVTSDTTAFGNGKNNGFTTNNWQEKHGVSCEEVWRKRLFSTSYVALNEIRDWLLSFQLSKFLKHDTQTLTNVFSFKMSFPNLKINFRMTLKYGFGKCWLFLLSANGWKDQNINSSFSPQRKPWYGEGIVRLANRVAVLRQSDVSDDS